MLLSSSGSKYNGYHTLPFLHVIMHAELFGFGSWLVYCLLLMKIVKALVLKISLSMLPVGRLHCHLLSKENFHCLSVFIFTVISSLLSA